MNGALATRAVGVAVALLLIWTTTTGCRPAPSLGPPTPTGATILGGPDMTSADSPPPGYVQHPVVPTSQQQAQDTVIGYLKKTLRALPPATTLDATRYSGGTNTPPCKDLDFGKSPVSFTTIGELHLPAGANPKDIISHLGDTWKSWGWYVIERDGFYKPNRFGYAPDGYSLQTMASPKPGYPPSLESISPCFSADLPDDRSPFPFILTAD